MKFILALLPFLYSVYVHAQDTIDIESKIEIVNGEVPEIDSKFAQYYTLSAYTKDGIEVFNETHTIDIAPSHFINFKENDLKSTSCHGNVHYINCLSTISDTVLNMEYDYTQGDTFAIRQLHYQDGKLAKSECISGCEYVITYKWSGDTLTEYKVIPDSLETYSYKIYDENERLIFDVWGSQEPIFEGYYYFDSYEWDDENYTCLKQTSASNAPPYYIEKTYFDDRWIPLRKEAKYANKAGFFDEYTIRFTRDFDSTLNIETLPKKWIRLTESDSGQVIYNHCAGGNYKISILEENGKKTLLEHGEQEDSEYWIKDISSHNNMLVYTVESKYNQEIGIFTFQWVDRLKGVGRWKCDTPGISERDELLVFQNFRNHFPIVDQPCVECWGDECDE